MHDFNRIVRTNLKFRHLHLLIALDEFRHLGRASDFLSLTQPAVSKSLAEIEQLLGITLFTRSTRGTEPTPEGATVVRFARSVLADFRRTQEEIAALASGAAGHVSVGAMVVATPVLLASGVREFKRRSPNTTVLIEEGDLTRLLPRLRVGELDFIVGRLEPGYAAPDLETEALQTEAMCLIVAPDHALSPPRKVTWEALSQQPWVLPPAWAHSRAKLLQEFYRQGLEPPKNVVETTSHLNTVTFMHELQAVAFVAQSVAHKLETQGLAKRLPLPLSIELPPVGMILLRNRLRTPSSLELMDCLRAQMQTRHTRKNPRHRAQRKL
jgi:DNA-binding transcriptional LysR family regulator